ncbi:MAG TPA: hypothetical protein VEX65_06885, partial [Flavisolibacter sp.]|nr:hypothetical protein [Flavisolibacter sp.]
MKRAKGKYAVSELGAILKKAAIRLGKNNPIHLAGSTAFLATFSLAPIFVMIVYLLGTIIGRKETKQNIIKKFAEDAPEESVGQ